MEISEGQTLKSRYRIEKFLGRGGMAEVYRVFDQLRGVHLAMKVLREDLAEDRVFMRRFEREANNLTKLQHPNIVRCYGLEQEGRTAFMLMDYIEGSTLRGEIFDAKGPMSMERTREILTPVCSALNYAHQMGMVHCDVKSANIMIHKNGTVYVTDFGIARGMDNATSTMVGIGTPAYMAPELIRGEDPTPQTDIYALGIVLYEMLTGGERPFTGERAEITGTTAEKVRWEHLKLEPKAVSQINLLVSDEVVNLLELCLQKDQGNRLQKIIEIANVINKAQYLVKDEVVVEPEKKMFKPAIPSDEKNFSVEENNNELNKINSMRTNHGKSDNFLDPNNSQVDYPGTEEGIKTFGKTHNLKMVFIPEGEFSVESVIEGKKFYRRVFLKSFWISEIPVTNGVFVHFLNLMQSINKIKDAWINSFLDDHHCQFANGHWSVEKDFEDFPVINVSWYGAKAFCEWAGLRLPTSAEWDRGALGTPNKKLDPLSQRPKPAPVRSNPDWKSHFGVFDMGHNIGEWTQDWFSSNPELYNSGMVEFNPKGPPTGLRRLVKGSPLNRIIDSTLLTGFFPDSTFRYLGFRCAKDAE